MFSLAFMFLTGCFTTTPLINPMELPLNDQFNVAEIDTAMQKAGVELGWTLTKSEGDSYLGTLKVRSHEIVVKFTRTKSAISAHYKSSTDLDYDGTRIHKKYHMWVNKGALRASNRPSPIKSIA
jgi:hypothetical protein